MKKNIGYVNLDSSIALWLMEHLPPGELKNGIEDLLNKECSSLILESDTDELSVWDHSVIRCGTLEIIRNLARWSKTEQRFLSRRRNLISFCFLRAIVGKSLQRNRSIRLCGMENI